MKPDRKDEYLAFQSKLIRRACVNAVTSAAVVVGLYLFVWKQRMGDWIVWLLETFFKMKHEDAFYYYSDHFRGNKEIFFAAAVLLIFTVLLVRIFRWVTGYFSEVNQGIEALLADDEEQIQLSPEMLPFERKLNTVKRTLAERKAETALAEQRAKRVHIALEKAYRLEAMINEFFEITRYNSQQITLSKETIDLYYMLVQLSDELSPVFAPRGNTVALHLAEDLTVEADPEKLARVFSNILKNAASYSYPRTEITISAEKSEHKVIIQFQNSGEDIPSEALASLFDKFYRADKSRSSDTGGTGLGLAIAKEIVVLHGGTISAASKNHVVTFTISLPLAH